MENFAKGLSKLFIKMRIEIVPLCWLSALVCDILSPVRNTLERCKHYQYFHKHVPCQLCPLAISRFPSALDVILTQHRAPPVTDKQFQDYCMRDPQPLCPWSSALRPVVSGAKASLEPNPLQQKHKIKPIINNPSTSKQIKFSLFKF